MKKALLLINQYFFNFLSVIFVFGLLVMFIMFTVPPVLWTGSMAGRNFTDNFGGHLLQFFNNDYITFFLLPFFPFLILFFLLSIFLWIYYRHDSETGNIGFRNTVLCILSAFLLLFLPIKAAQMETRVQEQRDKQVSEMFDDRIIYINKGFNKEFLKLYQTLADEDIQTWRKDPIAVVKYELEKGDLTDLSRGADNLTLKSKNTDEASGITTAVVSLENKKLKAEITLAQYWEAADGVWLVKNYKKFE